MMASDPVRLRRPFRLATTSFIVPGHIAPNVEKLAPFFDEIELLVFESDPLSVLPSLEEIRLLDRLSGRHGITYNVHLPVDVSLTRPDGRQKACRHLLETVKRFRDLPVTTYTLHLEMPAHTARALRDRRPDTEAVTAWRDSAAKGLCMLLDTGLTPESISVETLNYPFSAVEPLIRQFGLSVCIDAGHMIKYGYDLAAAVESHRDHLPLIHLHGVDFCPDRIRDHQGLDRLPQDLLLALHQVLSRYSGTVSLEVFGLEPLNGCLSVLAQWFDTVPAQVRI